MLRLLLNYICIKVSNKLKRGTCRRTGRNFSGKICVFHRGGGNKRTYRYVDFYRRCGLYGAICEQQLDPNRSAHVGLILYDNGLFAYIILSDGVALGLKIFSGLSNLNKNAYIKGSSLLLSTMSLFTVINSVEIFPFYGASIARAAGTGAILISKEKDIVTLKLRSGWLVKVSVNSVASIGYVSNMLHNVKIIGSAGKNRVLGKRPVVRGVAMNPCDHPHGGGNGKTSPPAAPRTPWGKITKWTHTKKKKRDKLNRRLFKKLR